MNTSYLDRWYRIFPDLQIILNKTDKKILSKIDPGEYIHHNLTQEREVLRIIEEHRPSAWIWFRLYPNLKDLSAEEKEILDHISPLQFIEDPTEEDLRNIIERRKKEWLSEIDKKEEKEALEYYKEHKDEIENEERGRKKVTSATKISALCGIAFLSAGIGSRSIISTVAGVVLMTIGPALSISKLNTIDRNSVAPKKKEEDVRFNASDISFIISYFTAFAGLGILLGSFLAWAKTGWDVAAVIMVAGGVAMIVAAIFLVLAIVISNSKR